MALSKEDLAAIRSLVQEEVAKSVSIPKPAELDIRTVGIPLSALGGAKPPVAADQCCNGCD